MREEAEAQRMKVEAREQETFAAQYQNVGLQEELENIKRQLKATEDERDAAKTSWKEEEVARIAAEGKISAPVSRRDDEFSSPQKPSERNTKESLKENLDPMELEEIQETEEEELRADLAWERKLRARLEDKIHFMLMECQFKRCSCRIAEAKGVEFVHDGRFNEAISAKMAAIQAYRANRAAEIDTVNAENSNPDEPHIESPTAKPGSGHSSPAQLPTSSPRPKPELDNALATHVDPDTEPEQPTDTVVRFSPTSGTFSTILAPIPSSSSVEASPSGTIPQTPTALLRFSPQLPNISLRQTTSKESQQPTQHHPTTPRPLPVPPENSTFMSRTTTTTVPLAAVPPSPFTPNPTMSREDALEQIRQRRGRARSIAAGHGTPRKQMIDLSSLRRDVSAPAGRNV